MSIPVPLNESERLKALYDLGILRTPPEPWFDIFTKLAVKMFKVPIAAITLIDREEQWFKSRVGLDATCTRREDAFCNYTAFGPDRRFVVPDAQLDARFAANPLVLGPPHIRFYAGVAIRSPEGQPLGALCIIDRIPRQIAIGDLDELEAMADGVEDVLLQHKARLYRAMCEKVRLARPCFPLCTGLSGGRDGRYRCSGE